jgi:Tol biopolymer transport system component
VIRADDVSPDGRYLLYSQDEQDGSFGLWLLPRSAAPATDRKPVLYLKAQGMQSTAQFSPDGKWVAYSCTEAGQFEIFVQSFPNPDVKIQVSNSGGNFPRWRRDRKELFYRATDGRLMVVSVRGSGRGLEFGTPVALFRLAEPVGRAVL